MNISHRLLPTAAALSLLALMATVGVGCSAPTNDDGGDSTDSAVTVGDAAFRDSATKLVGDVAAADATATGATKWHLYAVQAKHQAGTLARDHKGFIAYGTDKNDQVVIVVALDSAKPGTRGVQRLDPRTGAAVPTEASSALGAAIDHELIGLHTALDAVRSADASARWKTTKQELLVFIGVGVLMTVGWEVAGVLIFAADAVAFARTMFQAYCSTNEQF